MAHQPLALPHHEAVLAGDRLAVAQAELPALGLEGQQACHGMHRPFRIAEALAQEQQSSAFRHQGNPLLGRAHQIAKTALALGQLGRMQFGVAPWEQHRTTAGGQGLIGQGAPRHGLEANRF